MNLYIILQSAAALIVGGIVGVAFGFLQEAARKRNERRERVGEFKSGWLLMPGSGVRVAYLLVTLVAIQIICPLLFRDGIQWWVSGGVVGGYGVMLFFQLRQKLAQNK